MFYVKVTRGTQQTTQAHDNLFSALRQVVDAAETLNKLGYKFDVLSPRRSDWVGFIFWGEKEAFDSTQASIDLFEEEERESRPLHHQGAHSMP